MKRFSGGCLLLFCCLCLTAVLPRTASAAAIRVLCDGVPLSFDTDPVLEEDRVLVPMRGILEALGYTVGWQEETQSVLATGSAGTIVLPLDSREATVNGTTVTLDVPAQIKQDRTYVPLRFLAEYSGATVTWDAAAQTVQIETAALSSKDHMKESVVYIQTNRMQGSGVVLSADGLIVTNYHVIENAATAQFIFQDGTIYQGETTVVGLSPEEDIALLQIEAKGLTPAVVSTEFSTGDAVLAIGSPQGKRNFVTEGVILGSDRDVISNSAFISNGSSGGALFSTDGKLLGITSSYGGEQYFAIPIANVLAVPQDLSLPIASMKTYTYTPHAPQNLRYTLRDDDAYAYISWSPIYGADSYRVYVSYYANGPFEPLPKKQTGTNAWLWGFPQCFGISINRDHALYLKVTAVVDGVETAESEVLRVDWE